jgi:hypothetical protein
MSARLNAGQASKSSQDGMGKPSDGVWQKKTSSPSGELNTEPDLPFFSQYNLDNGSSEGQTAVSFFNTSSLASTELNQDWEYWSGVGDGDDVFGSSKAEDCQNAPFFELPAPLDPSGILASASSTDNMTSGTSPVSLDAVPSMEALDSQQDASAVGFDEPNPTNPKVRLHDVTDERSPVLDNVTSQITSRLGRLQIAEDGQRRYYGATSNLHLLHSGPRSLIQPNIRNVMTHGDAAIAQAGLQWDGDAAYENHLISLFFSWHNALMYVVDKATFLRERQQFRSGHSTDYYSPALENAVYVHPGRRLDDCKLTLFPIRKVHYRGGVHRPHASNHQGCHR